MIVVRERTCAVSARSLRCVRWTVAAAFLMAACASTPTSSDPVNSGTATSIAVTGSSSAGAAAAATDAGAPGSDPTGSSSADAGLPGVRPEGFDSTLARTTLRDGSVCELCVWVADTARQRSRGLMFVTDLGEAEAMAFHYPAPHTGTFWMKNTVLPLSIAFFAPDGGFLTSFDMEPCTSAPCPNYRTPADFQIAVEVPQGHLAELGLVEGSTFELLDAPCTT